MGGWGGVMEKEGQADMASVVMATGADWIEGKITEGQKGDFHLKSPVLCSLWFPYPTEGEL